MLKKFRPSIAKRKRALILLSRGTKIPDVVDYLKKRYHPLYPVDTVQKAYFPTKGLFSISRFGKNLPRQSLLDAISQMRAKVKSSSKRMSLLNSNPEFAKAHVERLKQRNKDPVFAAAHRDLMAELHKTTDLSKKSSENMKRLNSNPKFRRKSSEATIRANARRRNRSRAMVAENALAASGLFAEIPSEEARTRHGNNDPYYVPRGLATFRTPFWELVEKEKQQEKLSDQNEVGIAMREALNELPVREKQIAELVFGFYDGQEHSIEQAAHVHNISPKEAGQLLQAALKKLAQNKELNELQKQIREE
ncbi:MAG TPA: hypothetical protein VJG83_05540 [archaeon]|nr:hypothetical protein [archaeon]